MMTVNRILCLLAVDILGERSHGVSVAGLIINTTGKHQTLRRGVYVTLHRMVALGLLRQLRGRKENTRPYYRVTPRGRKALDETMAEFAALVELYEDSRRRAA